MPPEPDEASLVVHRSSKETVMDVRRVVGVFLVAGCCCSGGLQQAAAQCCLDSLFSGCMTSCRKPPAYAVAPMMAPVAAPLVAPVAAIPAPPPPVMVPVQQTSYVPETTYRTEYKCVPVTSYKPSCEIDPCTGCPIECMQPVTQYVQQPVSVPVTQYRAVTTTKYVQMQPGYAPPAYQGAAAAPAPGFAPAASPFSAVQTTPQAWGAAGADVSRQPLPGVAAPALPPAAAPPATTYQYPQSAPAPMIVPQSGVSAATSQQQPLQPTQPPAFAPAPSLRPIPEMPRAGQPAGPAATNGGGGMVSPYAAPQGEGGSAPAAGQEGMPVLPGTGPGAATGAFPRLLAPTSHTTSWQSSDPAPATIQYPTAALPAWRGQR
jgi:hypothetical protein